MNSLIIFTRLFTANTLIAKCQGQTISYITDTLFSNLLYPINWYKFGFKHEGIKLNSL